VTVEHKKVRSRFKASDESGEYTQTRKTGTTEKELRSKRDKKGKKRREQGTKRNVGSRDRYNELITLRSLAGSMHRAEKEKITSRERRRKKTESKSATSIRVHKGLENRSANFLVGIERIFSFVGNAITQRFRNAKWRKCLNEMSLSVEPSIKCSQYFCSFWYRDYEQHRFLTTNSSYWKEQKLKLNKYIFEYRIHIIFLLLAQWSQHWEKGCRSEMLRYPIPSATFRFS